MRYIIEQASWQEACNGIACAFCTLKDRKNGECKIRNYIHNQPIYEERPHGEWIPCSERLPEDEGKYLVSLNYGDVTMDSFIDGMFIMNLINVVAWMPLPEPYKRGDPE